jgi:hypothetical protein
MRPIGNASISILFAVLALVGVAGAGEPARNIRPRNHPHLAWAQRLSNQAFEQLEASQQANEFDLDGHAQKAKDALKLANDEMKLAAEASNRKAP